MNGRLVIAGGAGEPLGDIARQAMTTTEVAAKDLAMRDPWRPPRLRRGGLLQPAQPLRPRRREEGRPIRPPDPRRRELTNTPGCARLQRLIRQVISTVAGSNTRRAPLPGDCKVMVIRVLTAARLRDRSRLFHALAAFSAATSGASTFSRAAPSSSVPIWASRMLARSEAASIWARPISPSARIAAHVFQVGPDRGRLPP